jgi:GxxExxY protein
MVDLKYGEITAKVIGAAMEVHNEIGHGFPEIMYQRALAVELDIRGLKFMTEFWMKVYFKGHLIGRKRVDFFIEDKIMVELKAINKLETGDFVKGKNYLEADNLEVGLLINFGALSLEYKRLQNRKYFPRI